MACARFVTIPKLLDIESFPMKLKSLVEEKELFFWLGVAGTSFGGALGLATFFSNQPRRIISAANFHCGLSAVVAVRIAAPYVVAP